MQAVLNATAQEEEIVKEMLISSGKVPILIRELIYVEVWKEKIFPEFIKIRFDPPFSVPIYMVLYHEITLMTLLETIFFHQQLLESAEDALIDLIDYCFRKITSSIVSKENKEKEEFDNAATTGIQELMKQEENISFEVSIKAISVLSYVAEHLASLAPCVSHRLLCTHDFPLILTTLISSAPWTRQEEDGSCSKYFSGKWQKVDPEEIMRLTKTEGQVWLSLLRLLLDPECQKKYELNGFKKEQILKVRSYLHEPMVDQLPLLNELRRYLEHLSLQELPPPKHSLIIEQVSGIREQLLKQGKKQWKAIAKKQANTFFSLSKEEALERATRLSDTYNLDILENFLQDPPKCAVCGCPAAKRCFRCRNERYCRRECQVKHWPKHQSVCQMMQQEHKEVP